MTTISISNQKGGVGKTTSVINLSAYISKLGKRVLVLDIDPQANLSSGLGVFHEDKKYTTYELLVDEVNPIDCIIKLPKFGIDIIPSGISLAGAEVELVSMISRESVLKQALSKLSKLYDIVLIDCPPSLGLLTLNSFVASDFIIIPVQSEYYALEGLSQLLNTVQLVKNKLNSDLDILGIVITMYDSRTNLSKSVANELKKTFGNKVMNTIIPRNIKLSEAPSFGLPIVEYDNKSPGAIAYELLAKEFIERLTQI